MEKIDKNTFETIVSESYNIADVCRKIGWQPRGDNYKIVHKYIDKYNVDISHFKSHRTNIGNVLNKEKEKKAKYYLKEKSYVKTAYLKWKLFSEGIKEYKCEKCGCTHWNNQQIALQLHHINGDDTDNRLENLQILCPNCHSQTDNFCGRNAAKNDKVKIYYCKGCFKQIEKTPTNLCDECYNKLINGILNKEKLTPLPMVKSYGNCVDCGKQISSYSNRCNECSKNFRERLRGQVRKNLVSYLKKVISAQ